MTEDMYLSLASELYEKGTWDKDTFVKRVTLYGKERKIDSSALEEFIKRVTKVKEYSIEEKKAFLSVLTIDGKELKYGDATQSMTDDIVDKFYEMEVSTLDDEKISAYHNQAKNSEKKEIDTNATAKIEEVVEEKREPKINISNIISGNYTYIDVLGETEKDSDELFDELVTYVNPEQFNAVAESLKSKVGGQYAAHFAIEWAKIHSKELEEKKDVVVEEKIEESIPEPEVLDTNNEEIIEPEVVDITMEEVNEPEVIVPALNFEELEMPQTEEEYQNQANNILEPEQDSSVKVVITSNDRLEKLKNSKGKIINYFLKTAMVVTALTLFTSASSVGLIGGYLFFANEIKNGKFNPKNPVGKAIKTAVEKVMYIGMTKEEIENERGKSK